MLSNNARKLAMYTCTHGGGTLSAQARNPSNDLAKIVYGR
eukprot:CAMPEP_0115294338 /NCGR_PEP_ID=MMETSP0270-20121206/66136_1 /TAXON_ID=71861 /ORGANISM="Scrippsiella trochoidea, Strain CCMP3099" /LENGTH=39 /DNA_ID= /DNA_START= /DNA_END= /DNA_ORIENTATION=